MYESPSVNLLKSPDPFVNDTVTHSIVANDVDIVKCSFKKSTYN